MQKGVSAEDRERSSAPNRKRKKSWRKTEVWSCSLREASLKTEASEGTVMLAAVNSTAPTTSSSASLDPSLTHIYIHTYLYIFPQSGVPESLQR